MGSEAKPAFCYRSRLKWREDKGKYNEEEEKFAEDRLIPSLLYPPRPPPHRPMRREIDSHHDP